MTGVAGSFSNSMFNFLRNCQTVFQSSCIILHSHRQRMRVPISLHPHQHLLGSVIWMIASQCHLTIEVVSHWSFNLHLPDG